MRVPLLCARSEAALSCVESAASTTTIKKKRLLRQ